MCPQFPRSSILRANFSALTQAPRLPISLILSLSSSPTPFCLLLIIKCYLDDCPVTVACSLCLFIAATPPPPTSPRYSCSFLFLGFPSMFFFLPKPYPNCFYFLRFLLIYFLHQAITVSMWLKTVPIADCPFTLQINFFCYSINPSVKKKCIHIEYIKVCCTSQNLNSFLFAFWLKGNAYPIFRRQFRTTTLLH